MFLKHVWPLSLSFPSFLLGSSAGTNCEINLDDCSSNPCDYGICKDGINRYDCVCKPGFTGKRNKTVR